MSSFAHDSHRSVLCDNLTKSTIGHEQEECGKNGDDDTDNLCGREQDEERWNYEQHSKEKRGVSCFLISALVDVPDG